MIKITFLLVLACVGQAVAAPKRLVLIGGSAVAYNEKAVAKFVQWAKESGSKILRVSWASEIEPRDADARPSDPFPEGMVIEAPSRFEMKDRKKTFLEEMLPQAGGVYFTGGDQSRIMKILADQELKSALVASFESGVVFGGSSAGLAIMSRVMFTGEGDETDIDPKAPVFAPGLGLLRGVMLDQHFLKEKRLNRLMSAMEAGLEKVGLGVDEDSAVTVENNQRVTVLGPKKVVVVYTTENSGRYVVDVLKPGQKFDLPRN